MRGDVAEAVVGGVRCVAERAGPGHGAAPAVVAGRGDSRQTLVCGFVGHGVAKGIVNDRGCRDRPGGVRHGAGHGAAEAVVGEERRRVRPGAIQLAAVQRAADAGRGVPRPRGLGDDVAARLEGAGDGRRLRQRPLREKNSFLF